MKKEKNNNKQPTLVKSYSFTKGIRGKYAKRYAEGTNVVLLDPDVAKTFHESKAPKKWGYNFSRSNGRVAWKIG